mgnify:FL=1
MVRLRVKFSLMGYNVFYYFNSTMVRLRASPVVFLRTPFAVFQFHYGAIKGVPAYCLHPKNQIISIPLWCD